MDTLDKKLRYAAAGRAARTSYRFEPASAGCAGFRMEAGS